ncbi:PP2C family protein-serine/threonine phosphatase [Aminobacter niigataensis]|uniref:PP2C family protein-serine/threonine phosphatase n=1 Tax=Aminobacter niigataensis TaxID=83265 RepID=UPI0024CAE036|nr:protein phosphatase 2C domain-containing protein [Aminobacter niigataensis]CAI2931894.1 PPM-type phosphatase domain-containing protein [Aminobacter niigataensis]
MAEDGSTLTVSAATHRGRIRSTNEDAIVVDRWLGLGDSASFDQQFLLNRVGCLLAVADGIGGHRAGEIASRFLLEQLIVNTDDFSADKALQLLSRLRAIDASLREQMIADPSLSGMGSTLVAAVVRADLLTVVNVGDSRAYLFDLEEGFRQISVDHVPRPNYDIDHSRNGLSAGQSFSERRRTSHAITQAFGGASAGARTLNPHVLNLRIAPTDLNLLLCSDGLTDYIGEDALKEALSSQELNAQDLITDVLNAGGQDNISVILARYCRR